MHIFQHEIPPPKKKTKNRVEVLKLLECSRLLSFYSKLFTNVNSFLKNPTFKHYLNTNFLPMNSHPQMLLQPTLHLKSTYVLLEHLHLDPNQARTNRTVIAF